jgi:peroxiredoxin
MNRSRSTFLVRSGLCLIALTAAATPMAFAAPPATQPQEMLTPAAPSTQPVISADAQPVLDAVTAAYNKLGSLDLKGTLDFVADVNGETHKESSEFTSSFQSPVKFRHAMKDDLVVGCTGEKTFIFAPDKKVYLQTTAPKTKADFSEMPSPASNAIQQQNPSLYLALSADAGKSLADEATKVSKLKNEKIGDKEFLTLAIEGEDVDKTVLIDPDTHLVRQLRIDLSKQLKAHGAPNVKTAVATFNYAPIVPNADVKPDQFAWIPPADAKDASAQQAPGEEAAMALVGKPAPDFTLPGMDGKDVSMKDLKGNVIVLDFWATWCGPCVMSLPHLDKIYQDKKSQGLKVFAIDLAEDKDVVQKFITSKKLTIPVLLDSDGKTSESYGVNGIPHTVLIGKDGVVKKVLIGFYDPEVLQKAAETELAKK